MNKSACHWRQQGAALLAAMITVTLVATLAAAAVWRQWRGVEIEIAEQARAQSSWILTGALDWGRLVLAGDLRESDIDHLDEPWAVPLAEARLSSFLATDKDADLYRDAFLSGQVIDLHSRLNVMNLAVGDPTQARVRFARLFEALGIPDNELTVLASNLQRAHAAMAADDRSISADAPLLPRRFEQLAWLGVSLQTLKKLQPYCTLLPNSTAATPINLNTASALVIYAALPGIDRAAAERLVRARSQTPLRKPEDARNLLQPSQANDLSWAAVRSEYFEIHGRLRLYDIAMEEAAVVRRLVTNGRGQVITLWRERRAITVDDDAPALQRAKQT